MIGSSARCRTASSPTRCGRARHRPRARRGGTGVSSAWSTPRAVSPVPTRPSWLGAVTRGRRCCAGRDGVVAVAGCWWRARWRSAPRWRWAGPQQQSVVGSMTSRSWVGRQRSMAVVLRAKCLPSRCPLAASCLTRRRGVTGVGRTPWRRRASLTRGRRRTVQDGVEGMVHLGARRHRLPPGAAIRRATGTCRATGLRRVVGRCQSGASMAVQRRGEIRLPAWPGPAMPGLDRRRGVGGRAWRLVLLSVGAGRAEPPVTDTPG